MENQHRLIKGYKELSAEQIALINRIKEAGVALGELVNDLRVFQPKVGGINVEDSAEGRAAFTVLDQRWVSIGATDLQTGLMALTRAVARPDFF